MKIYTSYFGRLKELNSNGLHTVGIAVRPPAFYKGSNMPFFAPRVDMLRMKEAEYNAEFKKILSRLDPKIVKDTFEMMHRNFKKDIVLLCFEKDWNECHRKMVAEWLNEKLGWDVKEFQPVQEKPKMNHEQKSLF